jgi:hypothetical protein
MCLSGDGTVNWSKYDAPDATKRQLATYPSDAIASRRTVSSSCAAANTAA